MHKSDGVLKGVLFTLLFTLILAGNMVLGSPRNKDKRGDHFPLEEAIFIFDKIIWRCVCYDSSLWVPALGALT